jgi:hypothetical protein
MEMAADDSERSTAGHGRDQGRKRAGGEEREEREEIHSEQQRRGRVGGRQLDPRQQMAADRRKQPAADSRQQQAEADFHARQQMYAFSLSNVTHTNICLPTLFLSRQSCPYIPVRCKAVPAPTSLFHTSDTAAHTTNTHYAGREHERQMAELEDQERREEKQYYDR